METKEMEKEIILEKILKPKEKSVYHNALMRHDNDEILAGFNEINEKLQMMGQYAELHFPVVQEKGLKGFLKKIIKKALDWYVESIITQQTQFNIQVLPAIGRTTEILMSNSIAIDRMILNQSDVQANQHCNLKTAREQVIEYILYQMGIEDSECLDLRRLSVDLIKKMNKKDLEHNKAILLDLDKKNLMTDLSETFIEYAVVDKTVIFLVLDLTVEEEK